MTVNDIIKKIYKRQITRLWTFNGQLAEKFQMRPVKCNWPLEDQINFGVGGHWWLDVPADEVEEIFIEKGRDPFGEYYVPHAIRWRGHWFVAPDSPRSWFPKNKFYSINKFGIMREYSPLDAKLVLKTTYSRH